MASNLDSSMQNIKNVIETEEGEWELYEHIVGYFYPIFLAKKEDEDEIYKCYIFPKDTNVLSQIEEIEHYENINKMTIPVLPIKDSFISDDLIYIFTLNLQTIKDTKVNGKKLLKLLVKMEKYNHYSDDYNFIYSADNVYYYQGHLFADPINMITKREGFEIKNLNSMQKLFNSTREHLFNKSVHINNKFLELKEKVINKEKYRIEELLI